MGIPKDPRQQMINLMYLVLTALLALNVSAEVLEAFYKVNRGIQASTLAILGKNSWTYTMLQAQMAIDPKRVRPLYEKAEEVRRKVDSFERYVRQLRWEIIKESGGYESEDTTKLKNPKHTDAASIVMITKGRGKELQARINRLRKELLDIVASVDSSAVDMMARRITLKAEDPKNDPSNRNWVEYNFQMMPSVAAVVILNQIINDARTAEAEVINFLLSRIGAGQFRFDKLVARVVPNSNYILIGDEFKADIFVAAMSTTQLPQIYIGKLKEELLILDTTTGLYREVYRNPLVEIHDTVTEFRGGSGIFRQKPTSPGEYSYEGAVQLVKPSGDTVWFPFRFSYQASRPLAVISPTKMNVLYMGVDNPLEISVPGYPAEDVIAVISQGSIRRVRGATWHARVRKPGKAKVTVYVKTPDGGKRLVGSMEFRVKRIPDPQPMIGNLKPGKVRASVFKAQRGVIADPGDFLFDVRFKVLSFEMVYKPKRGEAIKVRAKGPLFNQRMRQLIQRARPGDSFSFYEIRVLAPDGTTRVLSGISYELI